MSTPTPFDDEHDAWLVQALRHAPDADAQPPQDLSDTILRQARQACDSTATRPARAPRPGLVATLWSWLARPQLSGALASLLVLVFAGVMWWDQPIDQVVQESVARAGRRQRLPRRPAKTNGSRRARPRLRPRRTRGRQRTRWTRRPKRCSCPIPGTR